MNPTPLNTPPTEPRHGIDRVLVAQTSLVALLVGPRIGSWSGTIGLATYATEQFNRIGDGALIAIEALLAWFICRASRGLPGLERRRVYVFVGLLFLNAAGICMAEHGMDWMSRREEVVRRTRTADWQLMLPQDDPRWVRATAISAACGFGSVIAAAWLVGANLSRRCIYLACGERPARQLHRLLVYGLIATTVWWLRLGAHSLGVMMPASELDKLWPLLWLIGAIAALAYWIVWLLFAMRLFQRYREVHQSGIFLDSCAVCAYDTAGLTTATCPECAARLVVLKP